MDYIKFLLYKINVFYTKVGIKESKKYSIKALSIIIASNLFFILEIFLFKGVYPNEYNIFLSIAIGFLIFLYLIKRKRSLLIFESIEINNLKKYKRLYNIHLLLTIGLFLYYSFRFIV